MSGAILIAAASADAARRLREACDRLDPRLLGWASSGAEEYARRLAREQIALARLAHELELVEESLRRGRASW